MMSSSGLLTDTGQLVDEAVTALNGAPAGGQVRELVSRLREPLRVAIAGNVKAGKSTLLNALVGQELAPTDAGECTRVVTWYREGLTYRARITPRDGPPVDTRLTRAGGAIDVDLGGWAAEDIDHLDVEWPSAALRTLTLIDTPGLESVSTDVSARSAAFLAPGEDQATAADAVLYLMRRAHPSDARFLEAFHDQSAARANPVNAIGLLARADEVGAGRLDALDSAEGIAARWRAQPSVRALVQTVLPIAGLLAATAATLAEAEHQALARIAELPDDERDLLLLSADRFATRPLGIDVQSASRAYLLDRLGLFGVRLSVHLVRCGVAPTATALADQLQRRSGMQELRRVLDTQFTARRDALKARSVLLALRPLLADVPGATGERLRGDAERILAGAHELVELRLLAALRAGHVALPADDDTEVERLLGADGTTAAARARLPADAELAEVREVLFRAIGRWRAREESPVSTREQAVAARTLVRSCEGALAALDTP